MTAVTQVGREEENEEGWKRKNIVGGTEHSQVEQTERERERERDASRRSNRKREGGRVEAKVVLPA